MRRIAAVLALMFAVTACGGTTDQLTVVASSPGSVAVGPQRVLMVVADPDGTLAGGPDDSATVTFETEAEEFTEITTEWVWAIEGVRGFYVVQFDFPTPGVWQAQLTNSEGPAQPATFQVVDQAVVPEIGTPAPASDSATTAAAPIEHISTDPSPDPAFYELSIQDAVTNGRPTVIVFATPAFCQTATCGPVLDVVKSVRPDHPDTDFVHVEVFENIDDPQGELVEVEAVREWGLQTEPWVFVVDREGMISRRFEGAIGSSELERALTDVES